MSAETILVVDGGNEKTEYVIADRETRYLGSFTDGSVSPNVIGGLDHTATRLTTGYFEVMEKAGLDPYTETPAAVIMGLAGVDTVQQETALERRLQDMGGIVLVRNDAVLPLSMRPDGVGVSVIAGAGQCIIGRNGDDEMHRVGGHGPLLDHGSARWITRQALEKVSLVGDDVEAARDDGFVSGFYAGAQNILRLIEQRSIDGRAGKLAGMTRDDDSGLIVVRAFSDLYPILYQQDDPLVADSFIKSMAPVVMNMAEGKEAVMAPELRSSVGAIVEPQGAPDADALSIAHQGAYFLAKHIVTVAAKLRMPTIGLVGGGSLLSRRAFYQRLVVGHLGAMGAELDGEFEVIDNPAQGGFRIAEKLLQAA